MDSTLTPADVGFVSGRLTVVGGPTRVQGHRMVTVRCTCGVEKRMRLDWLRGCRVKSCGCWRVKAMSDMTRKHGMSRTKEYDAWCNAKGRCFNPKDKEYPRYGGRGITMCDRWSSSFENFIADMGLAPVGYEIDRRDVNGNYEPSNCRWVPYIVQMRNMRTTKLNMEKARQIRALREEGVPYAEIRAMYGISDASIASIVANRTWKEGLL